MKKSEEIAILQSLKSNECTYFGEFFSDSDIDKMCKNIENDFPIELGLPALEAAKKAEKAWRDLTEAQEELSDERCLVQKLLGIIADQCPTTDTWEKVEEAVGIQRSARFKLLAGIPDELTQSEREYLVRLIENQ